MRHTFDGGTTSPTRAWRCRRVTTYRRATGAPNTPPADLGRLFTMKAARERIVMSTAWDYPSARLVQDAGIELVLVGDTAAQMVLGYDSTVPVSVDEMLILAAAVRRGLPNAILVGDLPFASYETSDRQAVTS